MNFKNFISAIFLVFFCLTAKSQGAFVVQVDTNHIRIGEQTNLYLKFYYNTIDTTEIQWPKLEKNIVSGVEIINQSEITESPSDVKDFNFKKEQIFIITSFEPKNHVLPSLVVGYMDSLYYSNDIDFLVETVEIDTSKGIVDIKDIYEVDYPISEQFSDYVSQNWKYILFIILLILIIVLFIIYNKRKEKIIPEPPKIIIPAHVQALKILNQLMQSKAWESDNKKVYYSELTDTVRLYLEERYGITALEKTTREIILDLKYADINNNDKEFLKSILQQADFVKFAKFKPDNEDGLNALKKSIEFVNQTKKEND